MFFVGDKMDIKKAKAIFNDYAKQFDFNDASVQRKYAHTYRVIEYAMAISSSLNLDDQMKELIYVASLYHDIGRFKQASIYHTFDDSKSLDHAKLGYDLLKDGMIDSFAKKEDAEVILFAVLNHSRKEIPQGSEDQILCAKVVRDADKMDIMKEQGNSLSNDVILSKELLTSLKSKEVCDNKNVHNAGDHILRLLGFIYDINFKYTYKFILKEEIIDQKIQLLEHATHQNLDDVATILKQYIEGVIKC